MKKLALSLALILVFSAYASYKKMGGFDNAILFLDDDKNKVVIPSVSPVPTASQPFPTNTASAPTPVISTPVPTKIPMGMYRDGQYTGNVADAYYGNVQVRATIQGGKITVVDFLQYPNDRNTSREINGQAMPYLKQEAIQAQSAQVDIISGATATSGAFRKSLASALVQAKN